jgi:hypothetical protein
VCAYASEAKKNLESRSTGADASRAVRFRLGIGFKLRTREHWSDPQWGISAKQATHEHALVSARPGRPAPTMGPSGVV